VLELRRLEAADLFERGWDNTAVGAHFGVTRQSVSCWRRTWKKDGAGGLMSTGPPGPKPLVAPEQLTTLVEAMLAGPRSYGFASDMWTCPRVGAVIKDLTGVAYHPGHIWKLLDQLGWSKQRPGKKALERDEAAIDRWREVEWPRILRNARRRNAIVCFQDETGISLKPSIRATWAPRGQTPMLTHRCSWGRLSLSGVIGYEPDGSDAWVVFSMLEGSYNGDALVEFLSELKGHLEGRKITLVWDNLPAHRSKVVKEWALAQRDWLVIERLPGYAPDLNPIEMLWGGAKGQELANLCASSIDEVAAVADATLCRAGSEPQMLSSFRRHCGLEL
jgi:transposase